MESSEVLAARLLELMGGKENIISVTHCATRLRPQLKDRSLVDADAIEQDVYKRQVFCIDPL